jgi:hypothetical protein
MMKRPGFIVAALVVGVLAGLAYYATRTPPDVAPMGDGGETITWISLAIAVVSLATAVVGLIGKLVDMRAAKSG